MLAFSRIQEMRLDRVSRGFAAVSAAHLLGSVLGLLSILAIVRAAGPGDFGIFSFGLTFTTFILLFSTFGTDVFGARAAAADPARAPALLGAITTLRLALGLAIFLAVALVDALTGIFGSARGIVSIFAGLLLVNAFQPLWAVQAMERHLLLSLCIVAPPALTLAFILAAAYWDWGLWGFAGARVAAEALLALFLFGWAIRRFAWRPDFAGAIGIAKRSAAITASQGLRGAAFASDIILIAIVFSEVAVGLYSAAFRIFLFAVSIGTMYFLIVLPVFAKAAAGGGPQAAHELRLAFRRMALPAACGASLMIIGARPMLDGLFGPGFGGAAFPLQVLMLAALTNLFQRTYAHLLLAHGEYRRELRSVAIATGVGIPAKLGLLILFGLPGAAMGTLLYEFLLLFLQRSAAKRVLGNLHPMRSEEA